MANMSIRLCLLRAMVQIQPLAQSSWIARKWMIYKSISLYTFQSFIYTPIIDYLQQIHNSMNTDDKYLHETDIDKEEVPPSK